jgi:hypothetical protein
MVAVKKTIAAPPGVTPEPVINPAAQPPAAPEVKGKLGEMVKLLSGPGGATLNDLVASTGWQEHSVRGALAGALKKRGLVIRSQKVDDVRTYILVTPADAGQTATGSQ